ncbi:MAG: hypothetical protein J6Z43_05150 [Clostridiales bacterium]|nr:hypothetical protein [Clostridiales bacterium]
MNYKKFLAMLLSLAMIAGSFPAMVLADEVSGEEPAPAVEETEVEETEVEDDTYAGAAEEEDIAGVVEDPGVMLDGSEEEGDAPAIPDGAIPVSTASDFGPFTDGCYMLQSGATYYVTDDIKTSSGRLLANSGNVTVLLNNHTISRDLSEATRGGSVFGVMPGATLTVTNGTVTGGFRKNDDLGGNGGGFNVNGELILENVRVINNQAQSSGGGIHVMGSGAKVTLKGNCIVIGNTAGTLGGGIYVGEGASLMIEGKPQVFGNSPTNVYIFKERKIYVTGTLEEGSNIGITHESEGLSAFTSGFDDNNHGKKAENYFHGDGNNVIVTRDGEARSAYQCISRSWDFDENELKEETVTVDVFQTFDRLDLDSDDEIALQNSKWYVLTSDKTYRDSIVRCHGETNILLCDGCTLTCNKGIIAEEGNTLNIYAQPQDYLYPNPGSIVATGTTGYAGIGGGNQNAPGYINIHGGHITATGSKYSAGIGGGDMAEGIVFIYGGAITAYAGAEAAGIGGGESCIGHVYIFDGTVNASGGKYCPGIGSGDTAPADVYIFGGRITAQGGESGSGIGAGQGGGDLGNIYIMGGEINAIGGDEGAGIGGGGYSYGIGVVNYIDKGKISISGGIVYAYGSYCSAGIGSGAKNDFKDAAVIEISGGTVYAFGGPGLSGDNGGGGAGIGAGAGLHRDDEGSSFYGGTMTGTITISGGDVFAQGGAGDSFYTFPGGAGIGGGYGGAFGGTITISGGNVEAVGAGGAASLGAGYEGRTYYLSTGDGKVSITGGSVELYVLTVSYLDNTDPPFAYSFIGRGAVEEDEEVDNILTIGDACRVSLEDYTYGYDERVEPCIALYSGNYITDKILVIETCDHAGGMNYHSVDQQSHIGNCRYCGHVFDNEDHEFGANGICTDCGYAQDNRISDMRAGYTLSLKGDIGVNLYLDLESSIANSTTAYVQFTLPNGDTPKIYVKDAGRDGDYYIFSCNVAAKDIDQVIKAQVVDNDVCGEEYSFTVRQYAEYLIANKNKPEFAGYEDLAQALLDYGAYAQQYFGTGSGSNLQPSAGAVDDITYQTLSDYAFNSNMSVLPDSVNFAGATLSLKSETTLSLYFETGETLSNASCGSYTVEPDTVGKYKVLRIRGISASDLDEFLTLTFTAGGSQCSVRYSPFTYCYNILKRDLDQTYTQDLKNLCIALYKYWEAAEALYPDND